ncbi:MAG: hypothetical protein R3F62_14410 [Planctomycetota bacterium]
MTRAILAISNPDRERLRRAQPRGPGPRLHAGRARPRARGTLSDARRKEVNQRFDRATLAFFSGATERADAAARAGRGASRAATLPSRRA